MSYANVIRFPEIFTAASGLKPTDVTTIGESNSVLCRGFDQYFGDSFHLEKHHPILTQVLRFSPTAPSHPLWQTAKSIARATGMRDLTEGLKTAERLPILAKQFGERYAEYLKTNS